MAISAKISNVSLWNVGPTRRIDQAPSTLTSKAKKASPSPPSALRITTGEEGERRSERATGQAPWRCEQLRRRRQASSLRPPSLRGASRPPHRRRHSPPGAASSAIVSAPSQVQCCYPSVPSFWCSHFPFLSLHSLCRFGNTSGGTQPIRRSTCRLHPSPSPLFLSSIYLPVIS